MAPTIWRRGTSHRPAVLGHSLALVPKLRLPRHPYQWPKRHGRPRRRLKRHGRPRQRLKRHGRPRQRPKRRRAQTRQSAGRVSSMAGAQHGGRPREAGAGRRGAGPDRLLFEELQPARALDDGRHRPAQRERSGGEPAQTTRSRHRSSAAHAQSFVLCSSRTPLLAATCSFDHAQLDAGRLTAWPCGGRSWSQSARATRRPRATRKRSRP
jgi:hypothetical protein